ncbi:MAG: hypothetical protein ACREHG_07930, partial [Candidatus Saccharimonadales bacterium]
VPTHVTAANGSIVAGDPLTSSPTPGVAEKATSAGSIIGYAESNLDGGTGTITVLVEPGYYAGPSSASYLQNEDSASLSGLNVSGDTTLSSLTVTGAAEVGSLMVDGNLAVGGSVNATSASIANAINAGTLNLSGPATVLGLTVNGLSTFNGDITVNGHVITGGNAPTTAVTAAAGVQQVNGANQNEGLCRVSGNDTSGTITLTTGTDNLTSGGECTLTFAKQFTATPRSMLSALDKNSFQAGAYLTSGTTDMTLYFINTPSANQTYTFNYWNPQ